MSDQIAWIRGLNQQILERIAARRAEFVAEMQELRRQTEVIQKKIDGLDVRKEQIKSAEDLQIAFLKSPESASSSFAEEAAEEEAEELTSAQGPIREKRKIKARIGEQRYAVLKVFREYGDSSLHFVVYRTNLPERRVKDAIVADVALGVLENGAVSRNGHSIYRLTPVGLDLMDRFEDYRRQKNMSVPLLPQMDDREVADARRIMVGDIDSPDADEAVGTKSEPDAPTASVEDDNDVLLGGPTTDRGPQAAERQVVHEKIDDPGPSYQIEP